MISSLKTSLPRFHENLRFVVLPFVVEEADGQLANFAIPNNSGYILADFTKKGASARKTTGPLNVVDGLANTVVDVPDASIEIEQGEADPSWPGPALGSIVVIGMERGGEVWAGRSTGVDPADPTSLGFEFAKSSASGVIKQLSELSAWVSS